jgi:peptidoglycan/LPS O-acetylase OafA/YrhL
MNPGLAVMFFYMISGFLMSLVLSEKYAATTSGTLQFYQSRFIRIYSLYWPTLLFIFFAFGFWGWFAELSPGNKFTNLFILGMEWRIMFASYPDWHWDASGPFFHQAWTLGAELTFYIAAPFILRSWRIALSIFVVSATIRGIFVATTVFDGRWTYLFLPSTFMFFLIGHFARVISRHWPTLKTGHCGALMLGLGFLACLLKRPVNWDSWQFWLAVFCFAASIPGVFERTKRAALLNALGDLSFPVYLVHLMVVAEFAT